MRKLLLAVILLLGIGLAALSWRLDFDSHNGQALGRSLAVETGAPEHQFGCTREGDRWRCLLVNGDRSAEYRVRRTDGKCWQAFRTARSDAGPALPRKVEGCLDVFEEAGRMLGLDPQLLD